MVKLESEVVRLQNMANKLEEEARLWHEQSVFYEDVITNLRLTLWKAQRALSGDIKFNAQDWAEINEATKDVRQSPISK